MTATLSPVTKVSAAPEPAPDRPARRIRSGPHRARVLAAVVLPPLGAALILLTYHISAGMEEPGGGQFALFWLGYLGGMLALVALACARGVDGMTRACALAGIGLYGLVPRLLRTPIGPGGSDEFAHMRQIIEAYLAGDVGHVSYLLPITKDFPGMHQAISALARLAGLAPWLAAVTVLILAHVLSVLAAYQLTRLAGVPARGAAAGAVMYSLNPSWLFFHTAVAYESLALPLMLWCLVAAVAAGRGTRKPDLRAMAAAVLCVLALPVIHHLTSLMLGAVLGLFIVARLVHRSRSPAAAGDRGTRRERVWPLLLVTGALLASISFWWSGNFNQLLRYLSPALTRGFAQIKAIIDGTAVMGAHGKRGLFADSLNPPYEIVSGYLFPFVALAIFLWSVFVLWHNRHRVNSVIWASAVLGAMYFLSLPMVLTSGGAEGAHRSWGYSFIGIAVLFGLAWSFGSTDTAPARLRPVARALGRPVLKALVVGVVFTIMSCGSAALGTNVSYRFPGGAHVGDDPRSLSKEGAAVNDWLAARASVDTPVMADRYVSLRLGSLGRLSALKPGATFPIWDLYMNVEPVRPIVLKQILDARIRYFVVDARMATDRPRVGYWFTKDEPGVGGTKPFPQAALDRFNCLPWLRAVYGAGPLTVYEVSPDILRRTAAGTCARPGG